jgi:hypothetical protein
MTHPLRHDEPGAVHHVMNRAVGRRSMFETEQEAQFFLSLVEREVRASTIRVEAYSLMTNHFHGSFISVDGGLSGAMRRIESQYVLKFNAAHDRDGPLMKGRFVSKRVRSISRRHTLFCYIDRNPADARIVAHGGAYALGSAAHYLRPDGPQWLDRSWAEEQVKRVSGLAHYDPLWYPRVFRAGVSDARIAWLEALLAHPGEEDDSFESVLDDPARISTWFAQRAALADGGTTKAPVVDRGSVVAAVGVYRVRVPTLNVVVRRKAIDGWRTLTAGVLRELSALWYAEIAAVLDCRERQACELARTHRSLYAADAVYRRLTEDVALLALKTCHRPE